MDIVFDIRLDNGANYKAKAHENLELKVNDQVIVRKDFYLDCGRIVALPKESVGEGDNAMPRIQRKATIHDLSKAHENEARAQSSLRTAVMLVERLKLPMKLLNAHYSYDGKLITIQFTADGRVDFRELVKELSHAIGARIELRQIGVRDETAIFGGIGVCGRPLCCCSFLHEFSSINVKMAKEQDLSLTPSTISGACGRLKCCLKYEHNGYLQLERSMPRRGEFCECPEGRGKIVDRNLLTQKVTIQLEGGNLTAYTRQEITLLNAERNRRSGQPRKAAAADTDNGKPPRKKD
ncbi:MAG: regulatory iron-sulfur-containing complex subunit RicT [Victivallales bacterium]|nr:regulatory iron-sulfur-containing complex subunit RicT [Victivallales bacterium]